MAIEEEVVKLLTENGLILSTAESCTGGMVASRIVNVSGASEIFKQGFITYSNDAKQEILGVKPETLDRYTAVSKETAIEMAQGCLNRAKADVAVAITGYAGPNDSIDEPKGLVYIACAYHEQVVCERNIFSGSRTEIREMAAISALNLIKQTIITTKERE